MSGFFHLRVGERLEQMSAPASKVIPMKDSASNKFVAALAIIATPFALGAFMLAWSPAEQFHMSNPKSDGYVQPRSVGDLVERTQESTVSVFCVVRDDDWGLGTAWAIELENGLGEKFPTTLITNHHVIEECIGGKGEVTVAELYEEPVPARIIKWDKENKWYIASLGFTIYATIALGDTVVDAISV
jgi:hypothetical protein